MCSSTVWCAMCASASFCLSFFPFFSFFSGFSPGPVCVTKSQRQTRKRPKVKCKSACGFSVFGRCGLLCFVWRRRGVGQMVKVCKSGVLVPWFLNLRSTLTIGTIQSSWHRTIRHPLRTFPGSCAQNGISTEPSTMPFCQSEASVTATSSHWYLHSLWNVKQRSERKKLLILNSSTSLTCTGGKNLSPKTEQSGWCFD